MSASNYAISSYDQTSATLQGPSGKSYYNPFTQQATPQFLSQSQTFNNQNKGFYNYNQQGNTPRNETIYQNVPQRVQVQTNGIANNSSQPIFIPPTNGIANYSNQPLYIPPTSSQTRPSVSSTSSKEQPNKPVQQKKRVPMTHHAMKNAHYSSKNNKDQVSVQPKKVQAKPAQSKPKEGKENVVPNAKSAHQNQPAEKNFNQKHPYAKRFVGLVAGNVVGNVVARELPFGNSFGGRVARIGGGVTAGVLTNHEVNKAMNHHSNPKKV